MTRRSALALSFAVAALPALAAGFAAPSAAAPPRHRRPSPARRAAAPSDLRAEAVAAPPAPAPGTTTSAPDAAAVARRPLYAGRRDREPPKVLGGLRIGTRELVVVTGASSGLGLHAAYALAESGDYFVVMAVRDVEKGKRGAWPRSTRAVSRLLYPSCKHGTLFGRGQGLDYHERAFW